MQQLSQTYRKLSKRLVFAEISSQVHFFESEHAIQTPLQIPKNGFTGRPGAIGLNAQVLMEPHETKKRVKGAACDKKPRSDCWLEMWHAYVLKMVKNQVQSQAIYQDLSGFLCQVFYVMFQLFLAEA